MQKRGKKRSRTKAIVISVIAVVVFLFFIIPGLVAVFVGNVQFGNIAVIPIEGVISGVGAGFGASVVDSQTVITFLEEAEENPQVQAIVLEINSPGGSAVASDEIATAVKKSGKPVVAVIREVGASGGYWVASAADYIVANRMSITGSIGVISSYLEFSGLMEEYGVGYERLVAGKYKDVGVPFRQLTEAERTLLQGKLDKIHDFFIEEIAANRDMDTFEIRKLATGEFYLGIEALEMGLIDQVGNEQTVETYLQEVHGITNFDYVYYQRQVGFFDLFSGVFSNAFFSMGQGIGQMFAQQQGAFNV